MKPTLIALGQRLAGDDGVGLAVADRVREQAGDRVLVAAAADTSDLISMLRTDGPVVIVDALTRALEPRHPGQIHLLTPEDLGSKELAAVSTHGMDVGQAISLARTLYPGETAAEIRVLGIEIERVDRFREGLSPEAAGAVGEAVRAAMDLLGAN
ncbi:MAG: hydrogenase maturation protease [Polyangiaceae bacterium]|nr:hydrogenase maturation protease [Polyangiaceae bacterium]